jgi:hypothetical protein
LLIISGDPSSRLFVLLLSGRVSGIYRLLSGRVSGIYRLLSGRVSGSTRQSVIKS